MSDETKYVVFDCEADGLLPTKFYCLSYTDYNGHSATLTDYQDIRDFFHKYDVYVAHNCRRWDLVQLEKVLEIDVPERIVDTLGLSWYLEPDRPRHGLEWFGEDFGIEKPVVIDWHNQTLESYIHRCEEDVKINVALWKKQWKTLLKVYEEPQGVWNFLAYLDFKMKCAQLAEASRWKVDLEYVRNSLDELEGIRAEKFDRLISTMPPVPITKTYERPKKCHNSDGQLSVLGLRWKDRLRRGGYPEDYDGPVEEITGYTPGNPNSSDQVKSWLYSLGWKPQTIKYVRDKKTGDIREIPQVNKESQKGGGVCDSVKLLYEKEPNLEYLDGLGILGHRIGILNGFLRDADDSSMVAARVAGLTNTLRFKHSEVVNLPKPEKEYGKYIRAALTAPDDDHELCGSDMSGLEDRLKQHFLQPHDPEYVESLQSDDYDPHLDIGVLAGLLTQEEADDYKSGDHSKKSIRSVAKNGNYSAQYGAGVPRIAITCGISEDVAKKLHKAYWERNWAIKAVAKEQTVKTVDDQMWLLNPISGFWYTLRYEKDIFSTLVQGSASFCFDLWVRQIVERRPELTGQFHDEIVLTVRKGFRDECSSLLREAIGMTNELLQLNRSLDIDIQYGDRYSDIH